MIGERKIVLALQKLDKKELKEFRLFVHSPYFNVNKGLVLLYDTLYPFLENKKFKPHHHDEWLWSVLFPEEQSPDSRRLNLLFYNLGLLFDRFITQQEFSEQTFFQKKILMEILSKRKLPAERRFLIRNTLQNLQKNENYSANSAVYQFFTHKIFLKRKRDEDILMWLNSFFIIEKLSAYVTLLSWKKMYKLDVELNFMEYVFSISNKNDYIDHPTIKIYQSIRDTFLFENDTKYYYKLRNQINEHVYKFDLNFQREIYTTAISYCINKGNQTVIEFDKESFDLFKESVEGNIIQDNNEISVPVFRNIVFVALRVKEFSWAEYFIENYKSYVNPKFRDNAVYFSLARLEMNRENYSKVLDYLQLINYDDVWYQLGVKTMQVSAYYELKEFDALESLLNAFKMYINREKSLTKERKATYINLVKYTKKLIYIIPSEKTKIQKIKSDIESEKSIVNKSWLMEKVDELSKTRY